MKICPKCGEEVIEGYDSCFYCGEELNQHEVVSRKVTYQAQLREVSIVFLLVAFFFPFIGLIIAILMRQSDEVLARNMFLVIFISIVFYSVMVSLIALVMIV